MKCEKSVDLVAFLKGELAESDRAPAKAHIDACEICTKELAKVDKLLKALGVMKTETVEASGDLRWRVRAAFVEAHPEFLERTLAPAKPGGFWSALKERFSYVPAWAVSLAIHVVLLAVATVIFFAPEKPEDAFDRARVDAALKAPKDAPQFNPPDALSTHQTPVPPDIDQPPIDWEHRPRDPKDPIRPSERRHSDRPFEGPRWSPAIKENRFGQIGAGRGNAGSLAQKHGMSGADKAVGQSLDWLARQQETEGHWDPAKFGGKPEYRIGVTGLALLAFLGNGETPENGAHAANIKKGIGWLQQQQRRDGVIGPINTSTMYNHGVATLALVECSLLTKEEGLKLSVDAAVAFTMQAQNDSGGWGYTPRSDENDTSVSGWQILVLRMALAGGNSAVIPALNAARDRLTLMTDGEGRVGYRSRSQFPNGPYGMTAVGMVCNIMSSPIPDKALLEKQAGVLLEGWRDHPVSLTQTGSNDLYYWFFASTALFQFGEPSWSQWAKSMAPVLMRAQSADGSWPANFDRWSTYGGQLYTTAMSALVLESAWRYPRLLD